MLSILSPCVWPLIPIVMTSAAGQQKWGPLYLALGLSTSFALAGGVLTWLLLNLGLDPEALRWVSSGLMLLVGFVLVSNSLSDWVTLRLSIVSSRLNSVSTKGVEKVFGQFGLGFLLGFVWLPCVGPTLGAAIALASIGENLSMSFLVMFAYGLGTACMLILAAVASNKMFSGLGGGFFAKIVSLKQILGWLLILLALLVLFGLDKIMEAAALQLLPGWVSGV